MAPEHGSHPARRTVPRKPSAPAGAPLPLADRLGRIWACIFLGIVVLLAVVLVGKAFLAKGG